MEFPYSSEQRRRLSPGAGLQCGTNEPLMGLTLRETSNQRRETALPVHLYQIDLFEVAANDGRAYLCRSFAQLGLLLGK
ncbi:MAG: hypothetical protein JWN45_408 [Acidobacteriaceae bacterium]|nr:hypothetical protein [Acidobacteriaceae bacterium]